MSHQIKAAIERMDIALKKAHDARESIPPNFRPMRLPYKIFLINLPPAIAALAAWQLCIRGRMTPCYVFLAAAVIMVSWIKNVSSPGHS